MGSKHTDFGKEKILGTAASKDDHANSILDMLISLKKCNYKKGLLIANSLGSIHLSYLTTFICINSNLSATGRMQHKINFFFKQGTDGLNSDFSFF